MSNPSTGEIHIEGIKPGIKTVQEAMAFRLGLDNIDLSNLAFMA